MTARQTCAGAVDGLDEVLGEAEDRLLDAIRAGDEDFPAPPD